MNKLAFSYGLLSIIALGCSSSEDSVSSQTRGNVSDGFTTPFQLAEKERFKECVAALRSEGVERMFSDSQRRYLKLSEAEFTELPAGERTAVQAEAVDFMNSISNLSRDLLEQAESSRAQGDLEFSKHCLATVHDIGDALAQPDRLKIFQQKGKAIRDAAEQN